MKLGNLPDAVALCRDALAHEAIAENESSLALALSRDPNAGGADLAEAETHAAKAEQLKADDPSVLLVRAQVAIRRNDMTTFRRAVGKLDALAPDDVQTLTLHALLAMADGKEDEAYATLDHARTRGLPDAR
jgi:Flp pilus assembly protein TadD